MASTSIANPLIPAAWHALTPAAATAGVAAPTLALVHSDRVELVYDHHIRKKGRTTGKSRVLVYRVSEFLR